MAATEPEIARRKSGRMAIVVRQDEAASLVEDDGGEGALQMDELGYLRVVHRNGTEMTVPSILELLVEQNSLLRRVVTGLELLNGHEIPDPNN